MILDPWDITVPCGNPRKPWQILGNSESPSEGCRVGEDNRVIRYNVMYTSWAICLSAKLFLFSFCFSEIRVPSTYQAMCQVLCLASLPPTLTLCCRYYYNSISWWGKPKLRALIEIWYGH